MWWHTVLSWCLWSVSCHGAWLIRPCYCNANRPCLHVYRKRQQITIFPLYCHRRHLSISPSVSLPARVSVSVFFVGRHLSQLICCQNKTRNFLWFFLTFQAGGWQLYAERLTLRALSCLLESVLPESQLYLAGCGTACDGAGPQYGRTKMGRFTTSLPFSSPWTLTVSFFVNDVGHSGWGSECQESVKYK